MLSLILACVAIAALYLYSTRTFRYWLARGVPHEKPIPLFGNNAPNFFAKKSMAQVADELYRKYPTEPVVGFYRLTQPELLIRDPALIKRILKTDFSHFYSRSLNGDGDSEYLEPLRRNLLVVEGDLWRLLRQSTTPAFTSGKLRAMFPMIVDRAERLQERTLTLATAAHPIDARDLMARYTTDFIGACGLGVDAGSLTEENSPFRTLGLKIFDVGIREVVISLIKRLFPRLSQNLRIFWKVEEEFIGLVTAIQKNRNFKPSGRHDFIDLMLEIKQKGTVECDSMTKKREDGSSDRARLEFDDALFAAQVFVFFVAGYETSASATSYTLHELAYNPEVQQKVQEEIDTVLFKHGNKLSFDAIKEMKYLEWTFKEGLRVLPPVGTLNRTCRKKYTFSDLGFTIDEGVRIIVSTQALHNDPLYWDAPEQFRPERFSPQEFDEARTKDAYLAFGGGSRACIGERLGFMQSLAGLAAVLSQFTVEPAPSSVRHPVLDPMSNMIQGIRAGLPLMFKKRKSTY